MILSKKHIAFTLATMIAAVMLVTVLAWKALKPVNLKNGFNRTFLTSQIQLLHSVPKPADVTDFAGFKDQGLIFKTKDPAKLLELDSDLEIQGYIDLDFPNLDKRQMMFNSIIDSTGITTFSGDTRSIIV